MNKRQIARDDLLTVQEAKLFGNTPEGELPVGDDWFKPLGVLLGKITPNQAREGRKQLGKIENALVGFALGLPETKIAMSLEDLDSTGSTVRDPCIGVWDEGRKKVVEVKGRDLLGELVERGKKGGFDIPVREARKGRETEGNSGPEGI